MWPEPMFTDETNVIFITQAVNKSKELLYPRQLKKTHLTSILHRENIYIYIQLNSVKTILKIQ